VAGLVLGVALVVGLAAGGGTVAAQSAPDCSTVGFTQNASGYYEVTNVDQLQCVGNASSGVALDDDYVLKSDIDASETSTWHGGDGFRPISASVSGDFTGTFDGNDSRITDLTIDRANEDETGLVAAAGTGAVFTDVTLVRLDVTGNTETGGLVGNSSGEVRGASVGGTVTGARDVGGLVGENAGGVSDATSSADVTGADFAAGGLIGANRAEVTESTADGPVTGDVGVGGLIGFNDGSIVEGSTANGAVSGNTWVGGLVGYNRDGTITTSHSTGDVSAGGGVVIGGLVGYNRDGTISTSHATGDVSAGGGLVIGGLVGGNDGRSGGSTVRESFANGSVTGGDETGGLVGVSLDSTILDSYALGDVDGNDNVGCLAGNNSGSGSTVETSYAACSVSGNSDVGGLIGTTNDGAGVTDSYWDTDEAGSTSDGGEGLPTANMTGEAARSNMTGFDFTGTWFAAKDSYPELSSNTRSSRQRADDGDGSTNESDNESSDAPEITNYEVYADGGKIGLSFDSDENLVEITVQITGAEKVTLDREDFSGDTNRGFSATYNAGTDGRYTVEMTEARDRSNNDGTEGETFRQGVTVKTEGDNGTATPTDNGTATPTVEPDTPTATPTDEPDTPTATPTDEPDTPTPTPTDEPDTPTPTQPEDTPGFGVVVTVLALLGAALLASRRRDGAA
jgi:PGF-CTERM protein